MRAKGGRPAGRFALCRMRHERKRSMLLFFLRHGDPIYDPDSLTELGRRQAEALGRRLAAYGLDRIFVSTSNRAIETARPTCELLKQSPVMADWANEAHAWDELAVPKEDGTGESWPFYMQKYVDLFLTPEMRALDMAWAAHPALRGTKLEKGIARIQRDADAFLLSLGYAHDHARHVYQAQRVNRERVALFAHQGFGLAFLSAVMDIPYPQFSTHFDMAHTGMTVLHFPEREGVVVPRMLQLSNDAHLYAARLPTAYQNEIPI